MGVREIVLSLLALVTAIVTLKFALKVVASLDLNRWLEQRRERSRERIRVICPHALLEPAGSETFQVVPLLRPAPLATMWICGRCQFKTHDGALVHMLMQEYSHNVQLLIKREKLYQKHVKKYLGI